MPRASRHGAARITQLSNRMLNLTRRCAERHAVAHFRATAMCVRTPMPRSQCSEASRALNTQRCRTHSHRNAPRTQHSHSGCALRRDRPTSARTSRACSARTFNAARLAFGSARSDHAHGHPPHNRKHTRNDQHAWPRSVQPWSRIATRRLESSAAAQTESPREKRQAHQSNIVRWHQPTFPGTHANAALQCMHTGCCTTAAGKRMRLASPRAAPHVNAIGGATTTFEF